MEQKKLMAVIVVAIIVIAGVGVAAFALLKGNGNGDVAVLGGSLEVYGNANGDYVIDNKDKELVNKIINEELDWKTKYPFADANCDGKVDNKDVTQIEAIINATPSKKVTIWHNNQAPTGKYVIDTKYPITAATMSTAQTTTILLKTLGIDKEIYGSSFSSTAPTSNDKYIYADYFDVMTDSTRIGSASTGVNVDTASNLVTKYGVSAYIYSSSSSRLTNEAQVEGAGIDCIQIPDGLADPEQYINAILLVGFLFDTGNNGYMDTAVKYVKWMNNYWADYQKRLEPIHNGTIEQKSAAASSMSTYVSVKTSSNTDIIRQAGLECPVEKKESSGTTITYVGGTDTWLNSVDLDYLVILKGSSEGWSWFDKDYSASSLPNTANSSSFSYHMKNFSSLKCAQEGNIFIVSTMMPGPLKSAVIAEFVYPELFNEGWANAYLYDFFETFWGFSESQCDGLQFILTQKEVLG